MLPSTEQQTEQSRSDFTTTRNRRYQIAGLLCFAIILTVACIRTLTSISIQHALGIEGDDEHKHESKSSESSSTSTTNLDIIMTTLSSPPPTTTSVIPTNIPSRMILLPPSHLPSHLPSLQPTVTDSNHPSLTPTVPLPSYSMVPSSFHSIIYASFLLYGTVDSYSRYIWNICHG
jgi:hypothetical protein